MKPERQLDIFLAALRGSDLRITPSRRAIVQALLRAARPLSAEELCHEACRTHPGVGLASVYRTLEALQSSKYIRQVQLGRRVFAFACMDESQHAHLICSVCHQLTEFDLSAISGIFQQSIGRVGFQPATNAIEIVGTCSACQ